MEKLAASIFRVVQEEWITLTMEAAGYIVDCVVLDVSKNHTASIFRVNQYNEKTQCLTLKMKALKSLALSELFILLLRVNWLHHVSVLQYRYSVSPT